MKKYKFKNQNRLKLTTLVILISLFLSCSTERYHAKRNLTVVFYNVENLYDTEDDPRTNDNEFLPYSPKKWTPERYQKKLVDISSVLSAINVHELPEIIGLCEVENLLVLEDLIETPKLASGKYEIVHYDSPDFRGIDCALLYRPDEFKVIASSPIKVAFTNEGNYTTRDILYVKGQTNNREEFHIFVNHWPSRIGGVDKTEPKRLVTAQIVKNKIDSIQDVNPAANIVVMGDMNDEPSNLSLSEIIGAKSPEVANAALVNLMFPAHNNKRGSYNYRGNWNMLDNMVVSSNLLDDQGFKVIGKQGEVFHQEWMENINRDGVMYPNRTYGGPNYYGGVSDHFPVYFMLRR